MKTRARLILRRISTLILFIGISAKAAESPRITGISPRSVRPGKKTVVTLTGANLSSATNLWASFGGAARSLTNSAERASFEIACPEITAGVHAVQVGGANGASDFEILLVDGLNASRSATADTLEKAQQIEIPSALDAEARKEKSGFYSFEAKAGDPISIEVIAQRLGSQMDPVAAVFDAPGHEIASFDDEGGIWRDARFVFSAPKDGRYIVGVHDVGFGGGTDFFYRLRVTREPLYWFTFPLIDPNEAAHPFEEIGARSSPASFTRDSSPANPPGPGALPSVLSIAEKEPNDAIAEAQQLTLPVTVHGKLQTANDIDSFRFKAEKGQKLVFQSRTRSLGSPCDLSLKLMKENGGTVGESDGTLPGDAALTNNIPDSGTYVFMVRGLAGTAQPGVPYRVHLFAFSSGVAASAETNRLEIAPGKSAPLKVKLDRYDYSGPVTIEMGVPTEGVSLENGTIPEKKNEADIKIKADSNLPVGTLLHLKFAARIPNKAPGAVSTIPALSTAFPLMPIYPAELDGIIAVAITAR
jgi:hypothetical protein